MFTTENPDINKIQSRKFYVTLTYCSVLFQNAVTKWRSTTNKFCDCFLHYLAIFPIHFLSRGHEKIQGKLGISISMEHLLSFQENTQTVVHWGFILCSISLALFQGLDHAKLSSQSSEQIWRHSEWFKQSPVDAIEFLFNLYLKCSNDEMLY